MTPRTETLRCRSLEARPTISSERAVLMTAFYREHELRHSVPVTRGLALRHLAESQTIYIGEGELIVGERGPAPKMVPTFPELTCHSLEDLRILNSRPKTSYVVAEQVLVGRTPTYVLGSAAGVLVLPPGRHYGTQRVGRVQSRAPRSAPAPVLRSNAASTAGKTQGFSISCQSLLRDLWHPDGHSARSPKNERQSAGTGLLQLRRTRRTTVAGARPCPRPPRPTSRPTRATALPARGTRRRGAACGSDPDRPPRSCARGSARRREPSTQD